MEAPARTARRSQSAARPAPGVNVGDAERVLSLLGGGALALLGAASRGVTRVALPAVGAMLAYRALSGHCSLYSAMGVNTADEAGSATAVKAGHGVKIERAVTINKPAEELYRFWRDLNNLPRFMDHVREVSVKDNTHSHWVAKAPLGLSVSWDAEIINDEPNKLIAWRSLPGGQVATAGSVRFVAAPAGRGTEVHVSLKYDPPGGKLGAWLATLFGESPETQVRADLLRLKQLMETGEIATVEGQSSGRAG